MKNRARLGLGWMLVAMLIGGIVPTGLGQDLYEPSDDAMLGQEAGVEPGPTLASMSLIYVEPPEPREFKKHDLITIIVDESSKSSASQKVDTDEESGSKIDVKSLIDPWELLELRLRQGGLSNERLIDIETERDYKGSGKYDRSDRVSARITAKVVEVKPNGTLLLEARKYIQKDEEIQTILLSGLVRQDDITNRNTVLSTQIADLNLQLMNEGEVREATKKGLITRVLDQIFAF